MRSPARATFRISPKRRCSARRRPGADSKPGANVDIRRCAHPPRRAVRTIARHIRPRCSQRPARGRKCSSPISASFPISPRARVRQELLRGWRHRGRRATMVSRAATRYRGVQSLRARSSPACARPMRSMLATPDAAKALAAGRAQHISSWPAGRRSRALKAAGVGTFILPAASRGTLKAAYDILGVRGMSHHGASHGPPPLSAQDRRRRRIEGQLQALRVMKSHLTTKDIVWAMLTIPGIALLCLLVAAKLHWLPVSTPGAARCFSGGDRDPTAPDQPCHDRHQKNTEQRQGC